MKGGSTKTDNHPAARAAKVELRRHVLDEIGASNAHVLDCFCGTGEMYRNVWNAAASYAGIDMRPWDPCHPPRFVANNLRVLRALNLHAFNVFDLDAYGSPWEQVLVLCARRKWAKGERGGLLLTDGSSLNLRWGGIPHAMAEIANLKGAKGVPSTAGVPELQGMALLGFVRRAAVQVKRIWQAEGRSNSNVIYTGLVFEGTGDAAP